MPIDIKTSGDGSDRLVVVTYSKRIAKIVKEYEVENTIKQSKQEILQEIQKEVNPS